MEMKHSTKNTKLVSSLFFLHAVPAEINSAKLERIANMGQNVSFPTNLGSEIVVDLNPTQKPAEVFHKYEIKVVSAKPKSLRIWFNDLECMDAGSNRRLNERIASIGSQIRFKAQHDDKMYSFCNVEGNVYIACAESVSYQNANEIRSVIFRDLPMIIVCNGYYSLISVFLFGKRECLSNATCQLSFPMDAASSIFCLEKRREYEITNSHLITDARATAISSELVRRSAVTMDNEEMPFASSDSDYDESEFIKEERVKSQDELF
jgi:hypothetical protein